MSAFASWYAERGYTCLEIDLGKLEGASTSEALMSKYEAGEWSHLLINFHRRVSTRRTELASHIRLLAIPFAPVIVSRAGGTLIAQTYISSYPATGLLLISPPPSNAEAPSSLLPTPLPEFDFEARFPCAVMCTEKEVARLAEGNRLWQDQAVDKIIVKDETAIVGQDGVVKIEQWLDDLGI